MDIQSNIILSMIQGFYSIHIIHAACEVGIFDRLYKKNKSLEELEREVNIESDLIKRIIRPLISKGFIIEDNNNFFLSDLGETLSKYSESSMVGFLNFNVKQASKYWIKLSEALKNKVEPHTLVHKEEFFEEQNIDGDKYLEFNEMMRRFSKKINLDTYFEKTKLVSYPKIISDIGGGAGDIIQKFLQHYDTAIGQIFDLPHVKDECKKNLQIYKINDRCEFREGDFFNLPNIQSDIFILSRILHDWDDEKCIKILQQIERNMEDSSKLVVIEKILPREINSKDYYLYMDDIYMWAVCGGRERTEEEFSLLFQKSNLNISNIIKISFDEYVIELEKDKYIVGEI